MKRLSILLLITVGVFAQDAPPAPAKKAAAAPAKSAATAKRKSPYWTVPRGFTGF